MMKDKHSTSLTRVRSSQLSRLFAAFTVMMILAASHTLSYASENPSTPKEKFRSSLNEKGKVAIQKFEETATQVELAKYDAMAELFCSVIKAPKEHPVYRNCQEIAFKCIAHADALNNFPKALSCISRPIMAIRTLPSRSNFHKEKDAYLRERSAVINFIKVYEEKYTYNDIFPRYRIPN